MTAAELQKFIRAINCMGDFDFVDMYADLGIGNQNYALSKYEVLRTRFENWVCEIDENTLNRIIKWVEINR